MASFTRPSDLKSPRTLEFTQSEVELGLTVMDSSRAGHEIENPTPAAAKAFVDSNSATTRGIFTTAPTSGPITTGADGARIDELKNETTVFMNIESADNIILRSGPDAAVTSVHNLNSNYRTLTRATDANMDAKTMPLGDSGNSGEVIRSLRLREDQQVTSSHVAVSYDVSTDTANRPARPSIQTTVEECLNLVKAMGEDAKKSYRDLRKMIQRFTSRIRGAQTLRHKLKIQQRLLEDTTDSLIQSLSDFPIQDITAKDNIVVLCKEARSALLLVYDQLKDGLDYLRKAKSNVQGLNTAKHLKQWFVTWYGTLDGALDDYIKFAEELDGGEYPWTTYEGRPIDFRPELNLLLNDERVSSHLKKCLCQTCPEQCHQHHTAYFSLEPQRSPVDLEANGESQIETGEISDIWQCHMAFKSTIADENSLIWLKVVSNMVVGVSMHPTQEMSHGFEDGSKSEAPSESLKSTGLQKSNRKRHRAPSPSQEPEPKAQKILHHQTVGRTAAPRPGVEVCLEYLAQHNTTKYAIMKMVDNTGCHHRVFYLPEEQRSAYGVRPDYTSLGDLLKKQLHQQFDMLRILRLARLVAEAIVRFDLRDSDAGPKDSIVFYGPSTIELAPFLEVRIVKPEHAYSNEDECNNGHGRCAVLLELGEILLQLGLERDKELAPPPLDLDARRHYIVANARNVALGTIRYSDIIKKCARFSADRNKENNESNSETFRETFYQEVVQPLKEMEDQLLSQQKEGKRWSGNIKGMPIEHTAGNAKTRGGSEAHA